MAKALRIFIIDDEMNLCRDLRGWLEDAGHAVHCASPSQPLTSKLKADPPDLIVLGVSRYTGRGMTLYRRLNSQTVLRHIPVIAVSEEPGLEYELLDVFDFQVRPFDRARMLSCLARLTDAARQAAPRAMIEQEHLAPFKDYLLEHSGLHFSQRNQRMLERGLLRRMQALQISSPQSYLDYLQSTPENYDELNKLLRFLTVGETCFFRYRSHREALLHYVLPRLIRQNQASRKLRVWSAGCSTGEEPYSLAILLLEYFPELEHWNVQITATDINKRALRQAREGIYTARSLRLMDDALKARYFEHAGAHYKISPVIRGMVRFNYLNLQTDRFPAADTNTQDIDLLFCRNVLIYFQLETIRRIIERFSRCLKPQGYLFLGHAETMQNVSTSYQRFHEQSAFFYQLKQPETGTRRSAPQPASPPVQALRKELERQPPRPAPRQEQPVDPAVDSAAPLPLDPDKIYRQAMQAFDREDFQEADRLFEQILEQAPNHPLSLVGKGLLHANQGDFATARQYCARAITQDDLLPEAYLLRGLILDMEERLERALVEYQKVLWLAPDFVMAHYLMAKIYARLDQPNQLARTLRNTIRQLEQAPDQSIVAFSGGLSRGVFLEIVHRELAELV